MVLSMALSYLGVQMGTHSKTWSHPRSYICRILDLSQGLLVPTWCSAFPHSLLAHQGYTHPSPLQSLLANFSSTLSLTPTRRGLFTSDDSSEPYSEAPCPLQKAPNRPQDGHHGGLLPPLSWDLTLSSLGQPGLLLLA